MRETLNTSRLLCPLPVIRTQDKVKHMQPGDQLEVVGTDPGILQDIPAWCRVNGHKILETASADYEYTVILEVGGSSTGTVSKPITSKPVAVVAAEVAPRTNSIYPEPFASRMNGRSKHVLGDLFGLTNFGVNLTTLAPGAVSALRHTHAKQDEFIYIISGQAALETNAGATLLMPGMCAGFKAGNGDAHRLVNTTDAEVVYLEIGDRTAGDEVTYPDDDIAANMVDGKWVFTRKNGEPH